ncbi:MAG: hypothetical protein AAGB15_03465 [Pseudomonadota bacterium]
MTYVQHPNAAASPSLQTILVVDDDPIAAEELAEGLELEGHGCIRAHSYDEAIELFDGCEDVIAIASDFYLSGDKSGYKNGLDLVDHLRRTRADRRFDCLILSGDADILTECKLFGNVKFLRKPACSRTIAQTLQVLRLEGTETPANSQTSQAAPVDPEITAKLTELLGAASLMRLISDRADNAELRDLAQMVLEQSADLELSFRPDD